MHGWIGFAITVVFLVLAFALGFRPVFRLLVLLPAVARANGFLQGAFHFCARSGTQRLFNFIPAGHAARGTSPRTRRPERGGGKRARQKPRSCAARRSSHVVALTDTEFFDLSGRPIIGRSAPTFRAFAAYPPSLRSVRYSTVPTLRHSRSQSISSAGRQRKTVDRERNEDDERSRERRAGRRVRSARRPNGPPAMRQLPVTMASIDTIIIDTLTKTD